MNGNEDEASRIGKSAAAGPLRCDIFCRVVDNFGDIGVTWRLARQLVTEHSLAVRLIVDDLTGWQTIAPHAAPTRGRSSDPAPKQVDGVSVIHWHHIEIGGQGDADRAIDIVIEAFQCRLPESYVGQLARQPVKPLWINLEYLSAEAWVTDHHLLPSPHPRLPLTKTFFFPGFVEGTGGLIREAGIQPADDHPDHLDRQPEQIFLFGYDSARALPLLTTLAATDSVVGITIPVGGLADTARCHRLKKCHIVPFVSQPALDDVLAAHDILFVRGEDSLVRAFYAAKPFVWQIYPQDDGVHLTKLRAFLNFYCHGLTPPAEQVLRALWLAVNDGDGAGMVDAWQGFLSQLPELRTHAVIKQKQLLLQPDLATNLMTFYQKFLKI